MDTMNTTTAATTELLFRGEQDGDGQSNSTLSPENNSTDGFGYDTDEDAPAIILLLRDNYWAFVGYIVVGIVSTILLIVLAKIYLKRRYDVDCCVGERRRQRRDRLRQSRQDAEMAAQLQRELDEEARQEAIKRKRKARWEVMKNILKKTTVVVKEEDLELPDDYSTCKSTGSDDDEDCDLETGRKRTASTADEFADDDEPMLCLPALPSSPKKDGGVARSPDNNGAGTQSPNHDNGSGSNEITMQRRRRVPGHCAVCIGPYVPGDSVIYSPNVHCIHAFHADCILTWLSRQKKRCPCCRHQFIGEEEDEGAEKAATAGAAAQAVEAGGAEARAGAAGEAAEAATGAMSTGTIEEAGAVTARFGALSVPTDGATSASRAADEEAAAGDAFVPEENPSAPDVDVEEVEVEEEEEEEEEEEDDAVVLADIIQERRLSGSPRRAAAAAAAETFDLTSSDSGVSGVTGASNSFDLSGVDSGDVENAIASQEEEEDGGDDRRLNPQDVARIDDEDEDGKDDDEATTTIGDDCA